VAEAFAGYNLKVQRTKNSQGWACFVLGHKEEEK
jgi:hypothetical protein